MRKVVLVSFADKRFVNSLKRLECQTQEYPFTDRFFYTQDNSLSKEFWRQLKPWFYRRGYGYWSWKFPIIKDVFNTMSNGDLLFFSDAGITWNVSAAAILRFKDYMNMLDGDNDILAFDQPLLEKDWTKGDILEELGVYDNKDIYMSRQCFGGIFMLKKTPNTIKFVDRMIELCKLKKELVTDKHSSVKNKEGFIENRHDQSVFSVLVKLHPHITINYSDKYEIDADGKDNTDCPIQLFRNKEKERNRKQIIYNKLLRPWREFLDFYFKRIRNYEYTGRYVW